MKVELIDPIEWKEIEESIDKEFGEGILRSILGNLAPVALVDGDWRNIYLVPTMWMNFLQSETPEGFYYHLTGKQLGVMTKDRFRLSLHILPELARITTKKLVVSKQGAESFTYGKSILKESVRSYDLSFRRNQRVLVMNEEHDCLGIAALSVDAELIERLSKEKLVGKNLVDIGWFIRRLG